MQEAYPESRSKQMEGVHSPVDHLGFHLALEGNRKNFPQRERGPLGVLCYHLEREGI